MYKRELLRLKNKLIELKEEYEKNKQERELLITEINQLDNQIEHYENIIQNKNKKDNNKMKNKKLIKKLTKECFFRTLSQSSILVFGTIIFSKWFTIQMAIQTFLLLTLLNTTLYTIAYSIIRKKHIKKWRKKKIEEIEKEYQKNIDKRLTLGQQYKQIRHKELESYNVYKITEQLIETRIGYLNSIKNSPYHINDNIHFNDIYSRIILEPNEYLATTENQKQILDEQLKKYLIDKISEIDYNISKSKNINKLTTKELIMVLSNYIPKIKHDYTLNHIIYAILGYASNMQSHSIVWYEEQDKELIEHPIITYDEQGRWNELKTHRNTDYLQIFNIVYDNFFNNFMIKENYKIRTK